MTETLVRDEVTGYGQHWVEVLRMGRPVERERWMERVPVAAGHLAKCFERHEKKLDVFRFYLWWPARELVRVDPKISERGAVVLWHIEKGQTIRNAAYNAAASWWLETECWPGQLMVAKVPDGVSAVRLADWPEVELKVAAADWLPRGYLAVA